MFDEMESNRRKRMFAGTLVLTGFLLGRYVSPKFYLLDAFVGANMLQSAITGFCPSDKLSEKVGSA